MAELGDLEKIVEHGVPDIPTMRVCTLGVVINKGALVVPVNSKLMTWAAPIVFGVGGS